VRFEFFGQGSLVERRSPGCRDLLESLRMLRETKEFAWPRRAAVRHEGLGEPRLRHQLRHLLRPLAGDGGRDEKAFSPVADCSLKGLFECELAEFAMQLP